MLLRIHDYGFICDYVWFGFLDVLQETIIGCKQKVSLCQVDLPNIAGACILDHSRSNGRQLLEGPRTALKRQSGCVKYM